MSVEFRSKGRGTGRKVYPVRKFGNPLEGEVEARLPPSYSLGSPGVASFLTPPGHPLRETRSVYTQYGNSPRDGQYWYDGKRYDSLDTIEKRYGSRIKPYDSPEVQKWEQEVYNYFRNSYSPDGVNRNVSNAVIYDPRSPLSRTGLESPIQSSSTVSGFTAVPQPAEHSLAWLHVREYYPNAPLKPEYIKGNIPGVAWGPRQ